MFTGMVSEWGLNGGDSVLCVSVTCGDYTVGKVYSVFNNITLFEQLLSDDHYPNKGMTVSTSSKFILPTELGMLLYLGECNGL